MAAVVIDLDLALPAVAAATEATPATLKTVGTGTAGATGSRSLTMAVTSVTDVIGLAIEMGLAGKIKTTTISMLPSPSSGTQMAYQSSKTQARSLPNLLTSAR